MVIEVNKIKAFLVRASEYHASTTSSEMVLLVKAADDKAADDKADSYEKVRVDEIIETITNSDWCKSLPTEPEDGYWVFYLPFDTELKVIDELRSEGLGVTQVSR
jgi:hypothetical protein